MRNSRRRRRSSHKLLAVGIAVLIIVALAGGTDIGYAAVKSRADQLQAALTSDLQAGQSELEAGKTSLTQANAKHDASLVTEAIGHFTAAKAHFEAAAHLADTSRLLHDLEQVPSVGNFARSRHAAVDGIAGMGSAISDAGQDLSGLDAELIKPTASGPAGRTLLTVLDQANASLVTVRADLQRAKLAASAVQVDVLPATQQSTFLKARVTLDSALVGLEEFERLVPVLKDVFGGNGVRLYLVEQVNPAELRAGGGFIGTYSEVRADHGVLSVVRSGDSYDLANPRPAPGQSGFIPEPGPLREVIPTTSWSFVDSNLYPDFPSNARQAMTFVDPRLGTPVDGVISMDYFTVAKVLESTGPIAVPGYGTTVDASNFVSVVVQHDLADPTHKAVLSAVAGPLMERVSALTPAQWPKLIGDLNGLAEARHLQAYFNDGAAEAEMNRVGWSGVLNSTGAADYMMEVESNYSGSKANYFLTRRYSIVLTRSGVLLHHKVTVDFVNNTPASSHVLVGYKVNIRLYVGGTASALSGNLLPVRYANPLPPTGYQAFDGWLPEISCCGGSGQAVFEYDTPWPLELRGFEYKIYWQKQPGTDADNVDVTWNDDSGPTYHTSGDLSQDRVIRMSSSKVILAPGHPAEATLPSLSLG